MDKRKWTRWILLAAVTALSALGAACVTTGSTGGYSLTASGGVGSTIDKPIDQVAASVKATFDAQGIEVTETSNKTEGDKRDIKGKKGDLDVHVELSYNGANSTKADVTVRKNVVTYDKDYAHQLMDLIVKGS
jgi:hypothetical protein